MNRPLQARVVGISEGFARVRLRTRTLGSPATAEIDLSIPVDAITGVSAFGTITLREAWAAEHLDPGVLEQPLIDEVKPASGTAIERTIKLIRRLLLDYHPDTARPGLFTGMQVAADLNALLAELRHQ